jgi:holo-[acyl-carrier protein] synthase
MKIGLGIDIEKIDRFRNLGKELHKIFTKKELAYCAKKRDPAPSLAARFAAKEAVVKAISSLGKVPPSYKSLEIYSEKTGVPKVKLPKEMKNVEVLVSLSHDEDAALAVAFALEMGAEHAESDNT